MNCPHNFGPLLRLNYHCFFFFFLPRFFFFLGSWNHDKSERNLYICIYINICTYLERERERERTRESTKSYQGTTPTYKVTFFVFFALNYSRGFLALACIKICFLDVALCLHDLHTCLVAERTPSSVFWHILWNVSVVKAAACKLVVC